MKNNLIKMFVIIVASSLFLGYSTGYSSVSDEGATGAPIGSG